MQNTVDFLDRLLESRNHFFRRIHLFPVQNRSAISNTLLMNEDSYLEILSSMMNTETEVEVTFQEPVAVVATPEQISHAIMSVSDTTQNCSVCQEIISSDCVKLRVCGHFYHRACIEQWFRASVRCPMCRHDIREAETSSDAT